MVKPNALFKLYGGRLIALAVGLGLLLLACTPPPTTPDPSAPTISRFEANPTTVELGEASELTWEVGGATSIVLNLDSEELVSDAEADGSYSFVAERTGEYTFELVATNSGGTTRESVTVTVWSEPSVEAVEAQVVRGSRLEISWVGVGDSFDVVAVGPGDSTIMLATAVTETIATVPIPASDHQVIRVVANVAGATPAESNDVSLATLPIVVDDGDYDPFNSLGYVPDAPIPGTLRYWIDSAPEGSIIGFASDITVVNVRGVEVVPNPLASQPFQPSGFDTHLAIKHDLTISGPDTLLEIRASSISDDPDEDVSFAFRSRAMLINHGVVATLENLRVTGGTYISNGAGVRNNGTLTIINSEIVGNRAWDKGGGVFNDTNAVLTIEDSLIADNQAATLGSEVGTTSEIRNSDPEEYPEGQFELPDGGYGGGLFNEENGTVTISNTIFRNNSAKVSGGGIFNEPRGEINMTGGAFDGNEADFTPHIPPVPLEDDWYFSYGGGVLNAGTFSLSNSEITDGRALEQGGGLHQDRVGESRLSNVTITRNSAEWGGGIRNHYCAGSENLHRVDVTINMNTASVPVANNLYQTVADETECTVTESSLHGLSVLDGVPEVPAGSARER